MLDSAMRCGPLALVARAAVQTNASEDQHHADDQLRTWSPVWLDLGTPDVDASAAFYGALFGWEFQSTGPEGGGYGMFTLGGKTVAAAGPLTEEGASPAWTLDFHTFDADATAKAVEQADGTVRFGPFDVFDQGRMAGFSDPTGPQFAVWQPGETKGLDAVNDPNTLCWSELYTTDPAAAKAFYQSVFDWALRTCRWAVSPTRSFARPAAKMGPTRAGSWG